MVSVETWSNINSRGLVELEVECKYSGFPALRAVRLRAGSGRHHDWRIRDRETAAIANQAALTGHFVLATLHTNSASASISAHRYGSGPILVDDDLRNLSQRLVRTLCPSCSRPVRGEGAAGHENLRRLCAEASVQVPRVDFREAVGCDRCNKTGYAGRIAIAELVTVDDDIKGPWRAPTPCASSRLRAVRALYRLSWLAPSKVIAGETTLNELFSRHRGKVSNHDRLSVSRRDRGGPHRGRVDRRARREGCGPPAVGAGPVSARRIRKSGLARPDTRHPDRTNTLPALESTQILADLGHLICAGVEVAPAPCGDLGDEMPSSRAQGARRTGGEGPGRARAQRGHGDLGAAFPTHVRAIVRAGEASGSLGQALTRAADSQRRAAKLHQLRTAMIYPSCVAAAVGVAILVLVGVVVPTLETLFSGEVQRSALAGLRAHCYRSRNSWARCFYGVCRVCRHRGGGFRPQEYQSPPASRRFALRIPVAGTLPRAAEQPHLPFACQLATSGLPLVNAVALASGGARLVVHEMRWRRLRRSCAGARSIRLSRTRSPSAPWRPGPDSDRGNYCLFGPLRSKPPAMPSIRFHGD